MMYRPIQYKQAFFALYYYYAFGPLVWCLNVQCIQQSVTIFTIQHIRIIWFYYPTHFLITTLMRYKKNFDNNLFKKLNVIKPFLGSETKGNKKKTSIYSLL